MDDLYREVILDHYKNPQYRGELDPHDLSFEDENPLCGDHLRIDLRVDDAGVVLRTVPGLTIYGPRRERGGLVSFTIDGVHPHDVASLLDEARICVRAGHHCAMPIHDRFRIPATTRASFYLYNTEADVERLAAGLKRVIQIFA